MFFRLNRGIAYQSRRMYRTRPDVAESQRRERTLLYSSIDGQAALAIS
jgi:hypothetical protein